jgi:hypothetical protein
MRNVEINQELLEALETMLEAWGHGMLDTMAICDIRFNKYGNHAIEKARLAVLHAKALQSANAPKPQPTNET